MRKTIYAAIALLCFAVHLGAQTASTPFPTPQYYASAFAQWALNGPAPNTYIWPGRTVCNSSGQNTNFFVFNTNAPVLIQDYSSASNSETATPSAIVNTAGSCGVTISPAHTHNSFQIKSGTAGLQEALNAITNTATYPALLIIDRNWYTYALNVPGTTPAAIIAAATGATGVIIEDITTAPATFYTWNGSSYNALLSSGASFPNLNVTSYTGISAPAALSTSASTNGLITTAGTGGTIPDSSTYRLAATYVDASGGETLISTDTASTSTIATGSGGGTNTITVTSPAAATGAVGWRLYMTAASGASKSEILYTPTCSSTGAVQSVLVGATVCPIGASATISAIVTGKAKVPAIATAYPRAGGVSLSFPPFAASGTTASAATATLGLINLPTGYLNTLGRSFRVCGAGYATTNGTGGTITFNSVLASVPGVTSITPFTVATSSIAASAIQVPFNFCVTYTTAATGATGTLEVHGVFHYAPAGDTVDTPAIDDIFTVSSTVDLTKQDQLSFTVSPTTTGLTAAQLRSLTVSIN